MITRDQAFTADVFHIAHDGLPCTVWHRAGITYAMHDDDRMPSWLTDDTGGFYCPVFRNLDPADMTRRDATDTLWHTITGVNAGDFHTADDCPLRQGADKPPVSDRSEDQPALSDGEYGDDGYDIFGFDAEGYDRNGYDAEGYDAEGYDAEGYDSRDRDADGNPRPGSMDARELNLAEEWLEFAGHGHRFRSLVRDQDDFRDHLRSLVRDPDVIDELSFCGNCREPAWIDDLRPAGTSESVCESCWDSWYNCDNCSERFPAEDLYGVAGDRSDVCESCRDRYYSYCESCDDWYHEDDADDHDHGSSGDGCCDSPQPQFTIRNDGQDPLKNDQRITVTLPAGVISSEGLDDIGRLLRRHGHYDVSYNLPKLGDQWQTRQGNYSKRLSRMAYNDHQAKLMPDVLSEVGNIARNHSTAVDVIIEISRDLNASAEYWYHEDSCWWGSYSESRCALKTNGGFGIRSFSRNSDTYPSGRAWVMPLKLAENSRLTPTFDTMTPDAFVVFNGYGALSGYDPARILAHMAGWTYRKIDFSCSPMWINAGGYIVAPEHIAKPYTDGSLYLSVDQHSRLFTSEGN